MNHREYFNQLAGKWDRMTSQETRSRLPELIKDLGIKAGDTILDVGGGTGILLPLLYEVAGNKSKIISLDIAEEMLKRARDNSHPSNIHYIHADVAAIPLANETFDLVNDSVVAPAAELHALIKGIRVAVSDLVGPRGARITSTVPPLTRNITHRAPDQHDGEGGDIDDDTQLLHPLYNLAPGRS
jgi:SAM-dependent methyltransferase